MTRAQFETYEETGRIPNGLVDRVHRAARSAGLEGRPAFACLLSPDRGVIYTARGE
jgi:hypothetical protein